MIVDSVLANAKAYINNNLIDCSIAIENGSIFKIGTETHMPKADKKTNLRNLLVLPGLIDVHVHLRDQGKAYKEDFYTGTAASAVGGITTVLDMPNNDPITMSTETLNKRMQLAERKILVNVGFFSEFPKKMTEIPKIVTQGAVGFKLFMACQMGGLKIDEDKEIQDAFSEVSKIGVPISVHAEDRTSLMKTEEKLKRTNRNDAKAFLEAHSEDVELKAVERLLKINSEVNALINFCHITTSKSLNAIIAAKKCGLKVTCEVTPHHLLLSNLGFTRNDPMLTIMPPLRDSLNVDALWKGINDSWIDVLGSDHAPHALDEKYHSSIWDVKVGVPGLETTLPLMLTMVRKNRLSLSRLVRLLAERPAEIFNLNRRGKLEKGYKADLVVVNFSRKSKIDASKFHSKAKYSPFNGWEVRGIPEKTYVNGLLIMEDKTIVAKAGSGDIIRSENM